MKALIAEKPSCPSNVGLESPSAARTVPTPHVRMLHHAAEHSFGDLAKSS